jgi:tetratricopeptide (TPR) repeat protein
MSDKNNTDSQKKIFLISIAIIIATLAVYWQVNKFDFLVFDDNVYVTDNINIKNGFTPDGLRWAFTTTYFDGWHPIIWLSYFLDYKLFGLNAGAYHLTNLILHILSSLLLFWLFKRMTGEIWKSAFVAAFFALHPLHVESVAWISERKDVLSVFFGILTLYLYVYYTEKPAILRYIAMLFLFACALVCKPMVVTLPVIMILLDYWPLQRFEKNKGRFVLWQLREKMPLFILSAAFSVITLLSQYNMTAKGFPFGSRMANAAVSFITYLEKTFMPSNLAVFYPFPAQIPVWQVLISTVLIVCISAVVIITRKRLPHLFVGWLWYAITILPVIGIIQIAGYAMADRYHYFPSIGIAVGLAWGIPLLIQREEMRKKILLPLGIASLAVMAFLTWRQCGYWKNSISLFDHSLQVTEDNYLARNNRGIAYAKAGQYELAIDDYNMAIRLNPHFDAYNNRGSAYAKTGEYQLAMGDYNKAIELNRDFTDAYSNRGTVYFILRQYQLCIEDFSHAIRLHPDNALSYKNRGNAYFELGRYQTAIDDYNKAIRLKPDYVTVYNNRGNAYSELGQQQQAIQDYEEAIRLNPDDFFPYYNAACCFAIQKNDKQACYFLILATEKGFDNVSQLKKDHDLDNIRNSACFIRLVKQMER